MCVYIKGCSGFFILMSRWVIQRIKASNLVCLKIDLKIYTVCGLSFSLFEVVYKSIEWIIHSTWLCSDKWQTGENWHGIKFLHSRLHNSYTPRSCLLIPESNLIILDLTSGLSISLKLWCEIDQHYTWVVLFHQIILNMSYLHCMKIPNLSHHLWVWKVQICSIIASRVWVSLSPLSVPIT